MHGRDVPIIKDQTTYWNGITSRKTFGHPMDWSKFQDLVAQDARVLDYGCGYGRLCGELAGNGFKDVIGADSSAGMIETAKNTYPGLDFRVVENSAFPFDDEAFDVVLLFTVLTGTPADDEQAAIVTQSHRVLRKGGILYVSDMPLQNDKRNRGRYEKYASKYGIYGVFELPDGGVMRHHEMTWVHSLLRQFQQLSLEEIDATTMNGNKARAFQYIGRKA